VDWRGDGRPSEPNKIRPAVVIEDHELFGSSYPMVILVPLTSDQGLTNPHLSVIIDPTPENGCPRRCYAVAPFVASTSAARVRPTKSFITAGQLTELRRQVALSVGVAS
jgi:mRNA-degrading endonuclease toxin of MazEF toxin-antitoxin module